VEGESARRFRSTGAGAWCWRGSGSTLRHGASLSDAARPALHALRCWRPLYSQRSSPDEAQERPALKDMLTLVTMIRPLSSWIPPIDLSRSAHRTIPCEPYDGFPYLHGLLLPSPRTCVFDAHDHTVSAGQLTGAFVFVWVRHRLCDTLSASSRSPHFSAARPQQSLHR